MLALFILLAAPPCAECHGPGTPTRSSAAPCQSCHTGTAIRNAGQIRYRSAFDPTGTPRAAADNTFALPAGEPYATARGHGSLKCLDCHGAHHDEPHAKRPAGCAPCHRDSPSTVRGGPHGMHPVGQSWVRSHGLAVDEIGAADCANCHGKDGRGTILSMPAADRLFFVQIGQRRFPKGIAIGCYSCHAPPK
jgi:hypothetical protein